MSSKSGLWPHVGIYRNPQLADEKTAPHFCGALQIDHGTMSRGHRLRHSGGVWLKQLQAGRRSRFPVHRLTWGGLRFGEVSSQGKGPRLIAVALAIAALCRLLFFRQLKAGDLDQTVGRSFAVLDEVIRGPTRAVEKEAGRLRTGIDDRQDGNSTISLEVLIGTIR
jgi:hypothetical protein